MSLQIPRIVQNTRFSVKYKHFHTIIFKGYFGGSNDNNV